jgi:hypothetical protein
MAPQSSREILCAEVAEIHSAALSPGDPTLYTQLGEFKSAALCLSGGGIRSAAFALGVIQALATHPRSDPSAREGNSTERPEHSLLSKFHYLSTVSGGGYIGSWLSAWRVSDSFSKIWAHLVGRPDGADSVRSLSNYLTPRTGITWPNILLWTRNILLNWFVVLSPICALVLVIKLIGLASIWSILWCQELHWHPKWDGTEWKFYFRLAFELFCGVAAIVSLIAAVAFTTRCRPSRRAHTDLGPTQAEYLRRGVLWSLVCAFLLTHLLASDLVGNLSLACNSTWQIEFLHFCSQHDLQKSGGWNVARFPVYIYLLWGAFAGAVVYGLGWVIGRPCNKNLGDFLRWIIGGAFYGTFVAIGLYIYLIIPDEGVSGLPVNFLHFVFGPPYLVLAQTLAEVIFIVLTSNETNSDADLEWLGKAAGWSLTAAAVWLVGTFLIFHGSIISTVTPWLSAQVKAYVQTYTPTIAPISGTIAAISGLVTAVIGKIGLSPKTIGRSRTWTSFILNWMFGTAAFTFMAALLILLPLMLDKLLFGTGMVPAQPIEANFPWTLRCGLLLIAIAAVIIIAVTASRAININHFSLHALYRSRLVRVFLGASQVGAPDRFTGFDLKDNLEMHRLWAPVQATDWRPFHVINIALNVSSERLSQQKRRSESFTVSPLHSGSSYIGYRDSQHYGGPKGITLGTAMAISGAAGSPSTGYYSSPMIAFLMTMFNERFGWWLGNPGPSGENTYTLEGPSFAIKALVHEALGLTTDDWPFVYLSDGGHFDNLGLYEMVRRRCRYILVCDAGCDPTFRFDDLANALRKIEIDLGVTIRFRDLDKLKPRPDGALEIGPGQPYHAMGEIDYRSADKAKKNGIVLYIKAGYHGVESTGVRGYASANRDFPHESTSDQRFTESQFESYRALGFEIADEIFSDALANTEWATTPTLEVLFETLNKSANGVPRGRHSEEAFRQSRSDRSGSIGAVERFLPGLRGDGLAGDRRASERSMSCYPTPRSEGH